MIRVASIEDDFARCAAINNVVNPDRPVTADLLATAPGTFVVHDAGYAYVAESSIPGSAFAMIRVLPESRERGVGGALLVTTGAKAQELGCTSMWGRVREGDEASLRFTAHRGFGEVNRDVDVMLEVAPGDGEVAPGIVELREEHLRGAHAVAAECVPEMALPQHAEVRPFDEWLAHEQLNSPVAFAAVDTGEVVGYARLYSFSALPHRLENGFTGVLRTSMVDGNEAMRAVNERLGYKPLPAWIVVQGPVAFTRSLPA
jgi:GNAT superfamily N-acetyltransferase